MTVGSILPTAGRALPSSGADAPLYLMGLADRRTEWASVRQAAISGNIANADTPGYRARDVAAFKAALDAAPLNLAVTRPSHMALSPLEAEASEVREADTWDVKHSANTVSLDEELAKADETARTHKMALSVIGTFNRMILSSVSFR
jgi:flagellar basal-body rod protein FlgB